MHMVFGAMKVHKKYIVHLYIAIVHRSKYIMNLYK